jgi:hypothetical protein
MFAAFKIGLECPFVVDEAILFLVSGAGTLAVVTVGFRTTCTGGFIATDPADGAEFSFGGGGVLTISDDAS